MRRGRKLWARTAAAGCLTALAAAGAAGAQVLTSIEFSFSNPGARSLGFGGAFVALADDATAAFANPAGLVQLSRPEVSLEGRSWSYSSPYTAGGRAFGTPTGLGIDTVAGPLRVTSEYDVSGLSYASFVYPRGRWSFAVYHHQLQDFELTQEIQGIFTPGPVAGAQRGPIELGYFDFEIASTALAVAHRFGDRLSLGLSLARFEPTAGFAGAEFEPDDDSLEAYFALASFLPDRQVHAVDAEMGGSDLGLAVGVLYGLTPRWRLGGVYREGADFQLAVSRIAGPASGETPGEVTVSGFSPWSFPDVFALGACYRSANGRWTGSFEWTRVEYSTVLDSLDPPLRTPDDRIDDADELHVGGEYAFFLGRSVLAIRLGAWHDPDHQQRNESSAYSRAELPRGDDELHLAAGFGVAFDDLQIDLGIDLSRLRDTASVSLIYSF